MKDWFLTPLVKRKGKEVWTGSWPSIYELPKNQRRDTACPFTYKNETRIRIKKWPDIIGIGAPKCGTGKLQSHQCTMRPNLSLRAGVIQYDS